MTRVYPYLALAGTIPFAFCATSLVLGVEDFPVLGSVDHVLSSYALVISVFLAGSHWGFHLDIQTPWSLWLALVSNSVVVALWVGFLTLSPLALLATFAAAFALLVLVDYRLYRNDVLSLGYIRVRGLATAIVLSALAVSGLAI